MFPPSNDDFRNYFARDFNFSPASDSTNLDYIIDSDITRAISEAQINFNEGLFGDNATMVFMYLVAYTLVVNLQNSAKGISSQAKFPISSDSVGGVAVNYHIPQKYADNAFLQQYTKNGYGMKYLELVEPYMVGVVSGAYRETSSR